MTNRSELSSIADLDVGLPRDASEIDATWMTAVLRTSKAIDDSTSVDTLTLEPFAVGAGLLSLLFQATMTYVGGSDGPTTLIVKLPTTDPLQRGTADQLAFYPREIYYYRNLAPTAQLRAPRIHAAMIAEDSTDFVLVMEDLSRYETRDQRAGMPWDDALRAVAALARFHAQWTDHAELDSLSQIFLPINFAGYYDALPHVFGQGWPGALEHAGHLLPTEIVEFAERWPSLTPFFLDTMATPRTLIHGDFRADNLFFDGDEVICIDYQIGGVGNGTYDLGYFVSQSIARDARLGREDELVDCYVAALTEAGIDADRGAIDRTFRIAVAHCFIYGVTSFQAWDDLPERSREVLLTMIERSAQAVLDLGSLDLLPN